jgi:pimeloyl-ACP methyl ester carboxylesterase
MVFERIVVVTKSSTQDVPKPKDEVERVEDRTGDIYLSVGISGEATQSKHCFVFIHGAGSSKYTWHQQIFQLSKYFLCLAPDFRGHGESSSCSSIALHLLVQDLHDIVENLRDIIGTRSLILLCHSVGGSIGSKYALQSLSDISTGGSSIPISAVLVLDLVEGTAVDSLPHMKLALGAWPSHFNDINQCIEFSIQQHRPRSHYSAHISVPPLLIRHEESQSQGGTGVYLWKTPLLNYEGDWLGWFQGFNECFLSLPCPHCLVVATIDRLDGQMSAAQMQGRFELFVTHGGDGGHFIQEDNPGELLGIIVRFLSNRGILSADVATSLLTCGLHSVAVGNVGLLAAPHISIGAEGNSWSGGGGGGFERYRSPFPKNP